MRTRLFSFALLCAFAVSAFATPQIQHWQAPSGAQVYFVEDHNLPMLDVAVSFPAGSAYDDAAKKGVAGLTHGLLDLGVQGMNEDDIARKLADVGARIGSSFDADRSSVTLRTLSSAAEQVVALDILSRVLQQPLFTEEVLGREKSRLIASLREAETKPEFLSEKAFGKAVFGEHPYGWQTEVVDIEKVQRADLLEFYRSHYGAREAVVALMGDVSRQQAEAIAQQLTAQLPQGGDVAPLPAVAGLGKSSEQRIPHPASQSHILIGVPGIARNDPDYFTLYVGNYILGGGGFVSRLMNEVREKRGMAYSVYSYFMPMQQPGAFQIGLQTKNEQVDEALQVVRKTVRDFVEKGVTTAELRAAKQNIIGGFPLRIDSNRKILEYLSVIGFYHLPLTYLDDFQARVEQVNTRSINEAFRRRINPDAMATVIVGGQAAGEKK
ncbi:MAG: pitrilysin family protein [Sideroxydans sp.]|nr:pitrilysin family protein [Sideroxydans sp.]